MGLYLFVSAVYGHMAGVVGFEPTQHTGSKPAALPTRLHPNIILGATFVQKSELNRYFSLSKQMS